MSNSQIQRRLRAIFQAQNDAWLNQRMGRGSVVEGDYLHARAARPSMGKARNASRIADESMAFMGVPPLEQEEMTREEILRRTQEPLLRRNEEMARMAALERAQYPPMAAGRRRRGGQSAYGGARVGGARGESAWVQHVKAFRAANPGMSYQEALQAARPSYYGSGAGRMSHRPKAAPKRKAAPRRRRAAGSVVYDADAYYGLGDGEILDLLGGLRKKPVKRRLGLASKKYKGRCAEYKKKCVKKTKKGRCIKRKAAKPRVCKRRYVSKIGKAALAAKKKRSGVKKRVAKKRVVKRGAGVKRRVVRRRVVRRR